MDPLLTELFKQGPFVAVSVLLVLGFLRGWWVTGRELKDCREHSGKWEEVATKWQGVALGSLAEIERAVTPPRRR
jgi:hypothetical protein